MCASARFWAGVLAELRTAASGMSCSSVCDGLNGLPGAIEATWPKAKVQTCVIHLIRASMKYVSWKDRKKAAAAMRPVCTALNEAAARTAMENLRRDFGKKNPGLIATWDRAWDQFVPFLEFDAAIRKVIYTTNAMSGLTSSCGRSSRTAAISLATRPRLSCFTSGSGISPDGISTATGSSVKEENAAPGTYGWKAAMNAFAVTFGDRVPV